MNGHEAGKRCDERALLKHTIETTLTTSRRRRSSHLFSMEKKKRGKKPPKPEDEDDDDAPKKLPPPPPRAFFSGRRRDDDEDEEEEEKTSSSSSSSSGLHHWDSFLSGFLNEKHTDDDAFKARVKARYHAAGSRDSCGLFSLGRGWQELCVAARPPGRSSGSFCATRSQEKRKEEEEG
jgi:hypothetical protein